MTASLGLGHYLVVRSPDSVYSTQALMVAARSSSRIIGLRHVYRVLEFVLGDSIGVGTWSFAPSHAVCSTRSRPLWWPRLVGLAEWRGCTKS